MTIKEFCFDEEFKKRGFLSEHIKVIEDQIESCFQKEVSLLRDINEVISKIVFSAADSVNGVSTLDPRVIAVVSGFRTLGNLQGAIILFEKGMAAESKTLVRCIYENAFCIGALVKDSSRFIDMLASDNRASKHGIFNNISKEMLSKDQNERLSAAILSIEKGKHLEIKKIADLSGLKDAYLYYKHLSNDSNHYSATAISKHVLTEGTHWTSFVWGVSHTDDMEDAAFHCSHASLTFLLVLSKILDVAPFQDEIDHLLSKFTTIRTS